MWLELILNGKNQFWAENPTDYFLGYFYQFFSDFSTAVSLFASLFYVKGIFLRLPEEGPFHDLKQMIISFQIRDINFIYSIKWKVFVWVEFCIK